MVLWPLTTIDRLSTSDFMERPHIPKLTVLLVCTFLVHSSIRRRASAIAGIPPFAYQALERSRSVANWRTTI